MDGRTERHKYRIRDIRQFTRDFLDPEEWEYANRDAVRFDDTANVECLYQHAKSVPPDTKHLVAKLFFSSGDRTGMVHAGMSIEWHCKEEERFLEFLAHPENYRWFRAVACQEQWEIAVGWDPFGFESGKVTIADPCSWPPEKMMDLLQQRDPSYYMHCCIDIDVADKAVVRRRVRRTLLYLLPVLKAIRQPMSA